MSRDAAPAAHARGIGQFTKTEIKRLGLSVGSSHVGCADPSIAQDGGDFWNTGSAIGAGTQRRADLGDAGEPSFDDCAVQHARADREASANGAIGIVDGAALAKA